MPRVLTHHEHHTQSSASQLTGKIHFGTRGVDGTALVKQVFNGLVG